MTEPHPESAMPIRGRIVYFTVLDDDPEERELVVEHIWIRDGEAGPCDHCEKPAHDPGMVGLMLGGEHAVMTAEEALVLANRLTRAASLVLESQEDVPDLERDMARFAAAAQTEEGS
jgi:hypothetical protein